jgi:hypothetical protein
MRFARRRILESPLLLFVSSAGNTSFGVGSGEVSQNSLLDERDQVHLTRQQRERFLIMLSGSLHRAGVLPLTIGLKGPIEPSAPRSNQLKARIGMLYRPALQGVNFSEDRLWN